MTYTPYGNINVDNADAINYNNDDNKNIMSNDDGISLSMYVYIYILLWRYISSNTTSLMFANNVCRAFPWIPLSV